jgi:uncharacterized membrane protein YebE (DUF533 family)
MKPGFQSELIDIHQSGYLEMEKSGNKEEIISQRKAHAIMILELWFLAENADGNRSKAERSSILNFIQSLFNDTSLFPISKFDAKERSKILSELTHSIKDTATIEEVMEYAKKSEKLSQRFYADACLIISLDRQNKDKEIAFLEKLASGLGLTPDIKTQILKKYHLA